jgi:hypothetical protein
VSLKQRHNRNRVAGHRAARAGRRPLRRWSDWIDLVDGCHCLRRNSESMRLARPARQPTARPFSGFSKTHHAASSIGAILVP